MLVGAPSLAEPLVAAMDAAGFEGAKRGAAIR